MLEPSQRTIATLDELDGVDWFGNTGKKDQSNVVFVNSWAEAINSCSTTEWESLTLEAANQFRERILEVSKERLNNWNEIREVVKPFTDALVNEKAVFVAEKENLAKLFIDCINWDIFHLCMEAEYSDIVEPGFFSALSYHYVNGHFPCGFAGDFPDGRFVVY